MNKQVALMLCVFVIALGSGVIVGRAINRPTASPVAQSTPWLSEKLHLSPAQEEQMRKIWSESMGPLSREHRERRSQLAKQRDEAIVALLSPEQRTSYDRIVEQYNQQVADLNHQREAAFQKAVAGTRAILNEEQRTKYDELLKNGFRGGPWGGRHAATGTASAGTQRAQTRPVTH